MPELDRTLPESVETSSEAEMSSHLCESFFLSPDRMVECEQPVRRVYQSLALAVDSLLEMVLDSSRQVRRRPLRTTCCPAPAPGLTASVTEMVTEQVPEVLDDDPRWAFPSPTQPCREGTGTRTLQAHLPPSVPPVPGVWGRRVLALVSSPQPSSGSPPANSSSVSVPEKESLLI